MEIYEIWGIFLLGVLIISGVVYGIIRAVTPNEASALSTAKSNFSAYESVMKLGPTGCPNKNRLCDYYMASSGYSVFPGSKIYDSISDQVIPLIVKAGARLVEIDVYDDGKGKPVVGLKKEKLGTDYAANSISFEACCVAIENTAFNSIMSLVSSDPFVLSIVFHTNNANVLNAAAEILKTTCRKHLLDTEFGYQRRNLATEPMCNLQNKLVIVSGDQIKGTHMEELVNLSWSTSNLRRMTYTQASQVHDSKELIDFNRDHITMVVPDIGDDLKNANPQILFTYGCQWVLMNYGSVDSMMEIYIGQFQKTSLVLKPEGLRALEPPKYKTPTLPDPDVSFQPVRITSPIYNVTV